MRGLLAVSLVACTPDWVDDTYAPTARAQAIAAAVRDHGCPADRVVVRCDATTVLHATGGLLAVGNAPDTAVQSLVDRAPQWELELDVCGHVRRYAHELRAEPPFVERRGECGGPACETVRPHCRSAATGVWWAVAVASPPPDCTDATIDWDLGASTVGGRLEVSFSREADVGGDCTSPSLFVGVDERWFALCGTGVPARATRIASGLAIAYGTHQVTVLHRTAHCRQSLLPPIRLNRPIRWADL